MTIKKPNIKRELIFLCIFIAIICALGQSGVFSPRLPFKVRFWRPSGTEEQSGEGLSEKYKKIDFNQLSGFQYRVASLEEPGHLGAGMDLKSKVPDKIMELNGQEVQITGFLMPVDYEGGDQFQSFLLLKAMPGCLFCQVPRANEWIAVRFDASKGIFFKPNTPVTIYGRFEVGEQRDGEQFLSLYRLKGEGVKSYR